MIFILMLVATSVVLWFLAPGTGFDFGNFESVLVSLSQLLGITGFMLFAINIILSGRFKFLENIFIGLNKVYEHHAQIGKVAFYLLLIHPLIFLGLFLKYSGLTFTNFISFFTPSIEKGPVSFGILALFVMIVLIPLTIYFRPKYHIWKVLHKFMGLAFFLGALHAFYMPSTVSTFPPLKYYISVIFAISMSVYIYRSVLGVYLIKKHRYIVSGVRVLDTITEVTLMPKNLNAGKEINFTPGQFAFVSFQDKNIGRESHPFSISSAPESGVVTFSIKNLGDFTERMKNIAIGSEAKIEGPFGKFSYQEGEFKKQIWIAGGIGITPFLSMAKSIRTDSEYSVDLYYCVKDEKEAVYLKELLELKNPKLNIIPHFSNTEGFINADIIKDKSGSMFDKAIFICSPPVMIHSLKKQFIKQGILSKYIYSEEFNLA